MTATQIKKLIGSIVGGWQLTAVLGSGKSATVFRAVKSGKTAAVKIFDPSLVEEFGREKQLKRVQRELSLKNHSHPHLIKIFDGGECKNTGFIYIAMELIDAPNLASVITEVPRERIRKIISQIADAAQFLLEELDIVHRDIKPDNVVVNSDFSHATVLDLGVIRPVDVASLAASSDDQRQSFLGKLRYSPPEYLFRTENKTKEGYRAITFYQLGGVLYDLIMKERLFAAFSSPYARLVKAVEQEVPKIQQADVPQDLIWLAKNCLLKAPEHRLRFVKWADFKDSPVPAEPSQAARERVMRRFASSLEPTHPSEAKKSAWDYERAVTKVQQRLTDIVKDICSGEKMFPRSTTRELPVFVGVPAANVLVLFEEKTALQIHCRLAVLVRAEILDIDPEVLDVSIRAVLGYDDSVLAQEDLRSHKGASIVQGVLDESVITVALEGAFFRAIDRAQATGLTTGSAYLVI